MNARIAALNSDLVTNSFCLAELSELGLIDFNFTTDLNSNCRDQRCAAAPSCVLCLQRQRGSQHQP
jgi:hypothetical protein